MMQKILKIEKKQQKELGQDNNNNNPADRRIANDLWLGEKLNSYGFIIISL